jgi:ABC-type antimicrobial peptide transport system permease subunit
MPGYFKSMGIVVQHGREFDATEPNTSVIVSESVVKRFWPGQDAIGKRIKGGNTASTNPWLNIVGVVSETRMRGLPNNPTADPDLYFPYGAEPGAAGILIRTTVDPNTIAPAVRNEIRRLDKAAVVSGVATMDELIRPLTSRSRFTGWLTGAFSVVALALAMVGVYGTMSYSVTQRSREIGIRMALGATAREVLRMVLGSAFFLIGTGLTVGICAGVLLSRGIHGLLFGVSPTEPSIFVVAASLVMALGTLAAFIPARRALRIDPMRALRDE